MLTLSHQAKQAAVPGRAGRLGRVGGGGGSTSWKYRQSVYISCKQAAVLGRAEILIRIDLSAWRAWGRSCYFEATNVRTFHRISVCAVYILSKILTRVTLLAVDTLNSILLRFTLWKYTVHLRANLITPKCRLESVPVFCKV